METFPLYVVMAVAVALSLLAGSADGGRRNGRVRQRNAFKSGMSKRRDTEWVRSTLDDDVDDDDDDDDSGSCELEIKCRRGAGGVIENSLVSTGGSLNLSAPVRLPIRGPRGKRGPQGERGERGHQGPPGIPGSPGGGHQRKRVAFFVGLTDNFGPVDEHTDITFDRVITNIGSGYEPKTGRFTAPVDGVYQFNVIISAQGRQKAAVMVLKNGDMVATVWAESIPYWSTASNVAVLSLDRGDQVWLLLLSRASYLHGYMYTTFSGAILFEH